MSEDSVVFFTDGLLSKWGFGDGDMLHELLWDWLEKSGRERPQRRVNDQHSWEICVLIRVVRQFVLPVIDQDVEVYEIDTIHNPIRVKSLNGEAWNTYTSDTEGRLTPEWVEVPLSEVLRVAEEERNRFMEARG